MTIFNDQWLKVGQVAKVSFSYIPLQGIERVTIRGSRGNEPPYEIIVYANGTEFIYKTENSLGDAESAATMILQSIEIAFGRFHST